MGELAKELKEFHKSIVSENLAQWIFNRKAAVAIDPTKPVQ